ncbi:MAG: hypothetical protein K6L75_06995 [Cellvibrionaceae bacterium]
MAGLLRSKIVLVLFSLVLFSPLSLADTVNQERAKLSNLKQTLAKQQQNYSDIQEEIKDFPEKLKDAQEDLKNAEAELEKAKSDLQNLKIEASKPGADLDRDIKLKEHSVKMAERRASREGRSLERVRRDEGGLQEEANKIKGTVDRLTRQVSAQERQVTETEAIARRQELEARTPKPTIPAPAPVIIKPAAPKIVETVRPTPVPVAAEKVPEIVAKKVTAPPAPKQIKLSDNDYEAYLVAERITKELEEKAKIGGEQPNITLRGSDIANTTLNHVGDKSFRGETTVVAGDQRIRVKNTRFRMSIPDEDDGETYVFVVDQKKANKPKVYYYKKSLVALIGTNPIKMQPSEKSGQQQSVVAKPTKAVPKSIASTSTTKPKLSGNNLSAVDLEGLEIAKEQMALLEDLKGGEGKDKPLFDWLTLSGKNIATPVKMEYLYQEQYSAETVVEAGRQLIKVNSKKFRIVIPEEDDGEVYMFYVDASNPQRLQLTFFKKALLDLL